MGCPPKKVRSREDGYGKAEKPGVIETISFIQENTSSCIPVGTVVSKLNLKKGVGVSSWILRKQDLLTPLFT